MGISVFSKIKDFGSELFDLVLGAEYPKVYYDPQGQIKCVGEAPSTQAEISSYTLVDE